MTRIGFEYQNAPRKIPFCFRDKTPREFVLYDGRKLQLDMLSITRKFRVVYRNFLKLCWKIYPLEAAADLDQMYLDPCLFSNLDSMMASSIDGLQFNA